MIVQGPGEEIGQALLPVAWDPAVGFGCKFV